MLKALEAAKAIGRQFASAFKDLFFTPEELEEERQAQAAADAQAEADMKKAELERAKAKLLEDYDGTLQSIWKHTRYMIDTDQTKALLMSQPILEENAAGFSKLTSPEQEAFIRLSRKCIKLGALPPTVMAGLLESALTDILSSAAWPAESYLASNFLVLCGEAVRYNTIPGYTM